MELVLDRLTKQYGPKIAVDRVSARCAPGFTACSAPMAQERRPSCA